MSHWLSVERVKKNQKSVPTARKCPAMPVLLQGSTWGGIIQSPQHASGYHLPFRGRVRVLKAASGGSIFGQWPASLLCSLRQGHSVLCSHLPSHWCSEPFGHFPVLGALKVTLPVISALQGRSPEAFCTQWTEAAHSKSAEQKAVTGVPSAPRDSQLQGSLQCPSFLAVNPTQPCFELVFPVHVDGYRGPSRALGSGSLLEQLASRLYGFLSPGFNIWEEPWEGKGPRQPSRSLCSMSTGHGPAPTPLGREAGFPGEPTRLMSMPENSAGQKCPMELA